MRLHRLAPLCAVVLFAGCAPAQEEEASASASDPVVASAKNATDVVLVESTPTTNTGNDPTLKADRDWPSGSGKSLVSLLRFDLATIPADAVVASVKLNVTVKNQTSGEGYTLYALKRTFVEGQATWNAAASGVAWGTPGARGTADRDTAVLGKLTPTAAGRASVTLTAAGVAAVQRWIRDPSTNKGFVLDATTNMDGLELASSEAALVDERPELAVDYTRPTPTFVHPGIYTNKGQLDFVKGRIAAGAQPWKGQLDRAKGTKWGKTTYVARPVATMMCGNSGSTMDQGCTAARDDSLAANTLALLWHHTGEIAYANAAIAILDAWAATLKSIPFDRANNDTWNGPLQAAWLAETWPRAAEILRHTNSGWSATRIAAFEKMLKEVVLVRIVDGWPDGAQNWSTSMANGTMNIGIFTNDRAVFDKGVAAWRLRTPQQLHRKADGTLPIVPKEFANADGTWKADKLQTAWYGQKEFGTDRTDGITKETCRDMGHVQMGLASIVYGAETGRIQGIDLYGEQQARIVKSHEWIAKWHNAKPGSDKRDMPTESWLCPDQDVLRLQELPTWEVALNHYARRKGVAMPEVQKLVSAYRAANRGPYTNLQMQWETWTHGDIGNAGF